MGKKQSQQTAKSSWRNYRPWLRLFVRLTIVAAVLLVGFLVWKNWEKIAPEAVLDWAEIRFGEAEVGNGFPATVAGNSVVAMGEVNQHIAVLTDTSLQFLDNSASRVAQRPHSFSNPALKTAGRYALVTEIGGSRFRLDTRRETVLSYDFENRNIYGSSLLPSGMVGVITDSSSQSYLCGVEVFNARGKMIFQYQSRKYTLTNLCLYPSGKGLAAVGTCAEGGALKSVLLLFDFDKQEPVEHTGSDVLLLNVNCFSGGTVTALGDSELWISRFGNKEVEKISYNGFEPVGYSSTSSLSGIILQRSGSTGDGYVWTVDAGGSIWKSEKLEGTFRSASCQGSKLLVLTESMLYTFSKKQQEKQQAVPSDSLLITSYRDVPLLLTLSQLERVPLS